jgi:hypothetical protein
MSMDVPFRDARYLTIATSLTAGRRHLPRPAAVAAGHGMAVFRVVLDDQPGLARAHRL